ncbi:hypothetical protein BLNAU_16231 [Blattamonas nauphoetae]|uniref:Right handed beta helix domain-containing protein n=1 Tax=Blattamonas nauphoetae TaxID=2049346 RepID=A0ABQ9XC98_9EUKA|nr:hypothetical protein BLNAU_16231 [Blattamonas nauphoetae]
MRGEEDGDDGNRRAMVTVCLKKVRKVWIVVSVASSSLTVMKCSFHKCTCTGNGDDGGAIFANYQASMKLPVSISDSSFTECTALGGGSSCGGAAFISYPSSITIENCFFEQCKTDNLGTLYLNNAPVTLSNCAFLMSSATRYAGGMGIVGTYSIDLEYLQFRDCSSAATPEGKDLSFNSLTSSQITSEMIRFCDSTSGSPNVFFLKDSVSYSSLVPQISSTISVTSLSVVLSETQAVVTVSTESAIKGSMGILLDGSNVPRLVHVVFGSGETTSSTGQATISSGASGMLPNAIYIPRSAAIVGHDISLPPFVTEAQATLLDPNTTEIVVRGKNLVDGSFWMEVWKGSIKWNISLEWEDSTSLKGTAPLYPSNADGRLDWSTEYEVSTVGWKPEGQQSEEEVNLSGRIMFTTPDEPARIEGVDCRLNGARDQAVVELGGVQLISLGQTVVLLGDSGEISSSGPIFDVTSTKCFVRLLIGEEEDSTHVIFGGRYRVVSVGWGDDKIVVNGNLFVDIPLAPTITKIVVPQSISSSSFVLSVEGTDLPSGSTFEVVLNSSHSFSVTYSSNTAGTSSPIAIGGAGQLKYDTQYTLSSVTLNEDGKEDEHILFSISSFTTPAGPTLSSLSCSLDPSDPDFFILSLTTSLMPSEDFILVVTNTESSSDIVSITVPSTSLASGSLRVEVYNTTDSLRYDSSYSVSSMTSSASSVVAVVSAQPFVTPGSPARIVKVESDLGGESEKSAIVKISGVSLVGEKTFTLSLARIISETELSEVEVEISGTLSGDLSSTSHTLTVLIFDNRDSPLAYGCSYRVTDFKVPGMPSKVDEKVNFSVPDEPPRIASLSKRMLNKERTKMAIVMIGRALKSGLGKVGLLSEVGIIDSLNEVVVMNETHSTAEFAVGQEETSNRLKFGAEYTLLRSASCYVKLSGTDLVIGNALNVTLNNSLSFIATVTSEAEAKSVELQIGLPTTLQYNTKYTITSIEAMNEEDGVTFFDSAISHTTGSPPPPTVTRMESEFVDGRKSCLIRLTGNNLQQDTTHELTLNTSIKLNVTFTTSTEGISNKVSIGESGILKYSLTYAITSLEPTNTEDGSILFDPSLSFTTGDGIVEVIVSEGGSDRTDECGSLSAPCGSIAIGWDAGTEEGSEEVILLILSSGRFGNHVLVGQKKLEIRGLLERESRVEVEEGVGREGKEDGTVEVAGGSLQMMSLTLRLPRPSLFGEKKAGSVVSGFGECVFEGVDVTHSSKSQKQIVSLTTLTMLKTASLHFVGLSRKTGRKIVMSCH